MTLYFRVYVVHHRPAFSTGAECKYSKRRSETQASYTLKNIIECSPQGAFKLVGLSKWLLFRQVAHLQSITLLIKAKLDPIWVRVLCELWDHKTIKIEDYQIT